MEFYEFSVPQKVFLFLVFLQAILTIFNLAIIFFAGLGIVRVFEGNILITFSLILSLITISGSVVTLGAIFSETPPYNLAVYPATLASLVLAIFSESIQTLYLALGILILYLQIRHPISLDKSLKIRKPQKVKKVVKDDSL